MSHVETIKCNATDLNAVRGAVERLGGKLMESSTYKWVNRHYGDYPFPIGFTKQDLGKCHYKAYWPEEKTSLGFEVGFVDISKLPENHPARHVTQKDENGKDVRVYKDNEFVPIYDFIDRKLSQIMGGKIGGLFKQAYALEKAKLEATANGYTWEEKTSADGKVTVEMNESYF